jgi:hypothetical protein
MPNQKGELTLADHAEMWTKENGGTVPPRDSHEYQEMYQRWIAYAFADFDKPKRRNRK